MSMERQLPYIKEYSTERSDAKGDKVIWAIVILLALVSLLVV